MAKPQDWLNSVEEWLRRRDDLLAARVELIAAQEKLLARREELLSKKDELLRKREDLLEKLPDELVSLLSEDLVAKLAGTAPVGASDSADGSAPSSGSSPTVSSPSASRTSFRGGDSSGSDATDGSGSSLTLPLEDAVTQVEGYPPIPHNIGDLGVAPWGAADEDAEPIDCPNVAVIFEGGGMRNAYTAACVQALIDHKVNPGWVGGISAGTTHTVNFLLRDRERARQSFVDFSEDPRFAGWNHFAHGRGYFNTEFIYEESVQPGEIAELDFPRFQASREQFALGALNALTGEMTYWRREDVDVKEDLMSYTRASSTVPFFMPVAYVDDVPYFDGALGPTGGFATDAAVADGYEKFLIFMTRPRDFYRQPMSRPKIVERYFRKYPRVAEAIIARAENYNATKRQIAQWEAEGKAMVFYPEDMPIDNRERNIDKLWLTYGLGCLQMGEEWEAWEKFLRS